jgi:hypothetical protein
MGLFSKRKKPLLGALLTEEEMQPVDPVNFDSVQAYLVGLSRQDYDKMLKVSAIYREANKNTAKILGVKDEPTTSIKEEIEPPEVSEKPPVDPELEAEIDAAFLDDDEIVNSKSIKVDQK